MQERFDAALLLTYLQSGCVSLNLLGFAFLEPAYGGSVLRFLATLAVPNNTTGRSIWQKSRSAHNGGRGLGEPEEVNRQGAKAAKQIREPNAELLGLVHRVIGAALEVYRVLGFGFLEPSYGGSVLRLLALLAPWRFKK